MGNDYSRQLGRGGLGAVLGSKRAKAIAVRGTRAIRLGSPPRVLAVAGHALPVADPETFVEAVDADLKQIFQNEWVPHKRQHGTIGSLDGLHTLGIVPVANFTR